MTGVQTCALPICLTNLLPDNVKLTSDSSEDVWVTVSILPAGSREFEFPTKNIEVKNKLKDLQVTFETAQILSLIHI